MAYLEVLSGYNIGQRIELIEEMHVGRASDNDLCLLDPSVSRYHALITPYRHGFILQDLHSSNGTKLRQNLLPPDMLQGLLPGDLIEFGNTQLRYHAVSINTPQTDQTEPGVVKIPPPRACNSDPIFIPSLQIMKSQATRRPEQK